MSEASLSRRLATVVVDILKKRGHILVATGGTENLIRELDALMVGTLMPLLPRLMPAPITGEVTSTFADEDADEQVEEMVGTLAEALMDSDHVEDVFAEDRVIRRDVFRTIRDELLFGIREEEHAEEEESAPPISVRLDTLGYVASTAAKLSDEMTLRDALERAGLSAEGELVKYDPKTREASFSAADDDPEHRLEIEEAVADELGDLVDMGLVELPTEVRRIPVSIPPSADPSDVRSRLDQLVKAALVASGCPTTWKLDGGSVVEVTFTPMSESDRQAVDGITAHLERGVEELMARLGASPVEPTPTPAKAPAKKAATKKASAKKVATKKTAAKKAPAKKTAAKKAPVKKATAKK